MSIPVIICDDSSMARKQMWRALPTDWDFEVSFAANGKEALDATHNGKGKILFLDLTMPVMDGFEVLEVLYKAKNPIKVIVVSGDIQPEAYTRVMQLGALAFIKKPFTASQIIELLDPLIPHGSGQSNPHDVEFAVNSKDVFQEVANLAMGRAADLLAKYLDNFIVMPIPHVNIMAVNEVQMALDHTLGSDDTLTVCQGFISPEISGEALAVFVGTNFNELATLLKYQGAIDESARLELVMDITSILVGATLKSLAIQLDISFCQGYPIVIGHHINKTELLKNGQKNWKETLAIEMFFSVEDKDIYCDFLLVFNTESIGALRERISYITD